MTLVNHMEVLKTAGRGDTKLDSRLVLRKDQRMYN